MENQNQQTQPPQSPNQTSLVTNNSNKSKVIPIILGIAAAIVIAIGAYVLGTKQSEPVVQKSVQTTPIPTPTPDPTANWKTYKNEKYGFEFQYPEEFSLKEGRDVSELNYKSGIIFSGLELRSDMVTLFFNVHNNSQLLNLDDYIMNEYGKNGPLIYKDLTQNEFVEWVNEKRGSIDIWTYGLRPNRGGFESNAFLKDTKNSNTIIVMNFNTDNEKESAENDYETLDQILSTFKFTN